MSRSITISEPTAGELLNLAVTGAAVALSRPARDELRGQLAPADPLPPPSGPHPVPGFAHVIWKEWDGRTVPSPINTVDEGGWKPNSILVIAFTASVGGSASIAPWPNDGTFPRQTVALGTAPGDFSLPFPYCRKDQNPGMQWQVGGSSRTKCVLNPGARYYLCYTWDGQDMRIQVNPSRQP